MKIHGLDLDNSPLISQDKALRYAENIAIGEGNQSYINEDGFNRVADLIENFKLIFNSNDTHIENIGTIPTNIGVVLFCIYGDLDSNVRRELIVDIITKSDNIEINKILYTEAGNDNSLNFSKDRPIHGDYIYNYKNELIVAFTEGIGNDTNETRVINLTTPYGGISEDSLRYKITNISSLNLIPNVEYPQITINVEEGGNLKSGAYQIGIKYKLQDGSYTNYSILSVPVIVCGKYGEDIKPDIEINRKITVTFDEPIGNKFTHYKLAIVHCIDTTQNCYETEDIKIENTIQSYIISNLINYDTIVLDDIFIKNISYIKEQTLVNYNNRLIRGNVQTLDIKRFDNEISNILKDFEVLATFRDINKLEPKEQNISPYFKTGESYLLYVGFLDYKGDIINIYNIPNDNANNKFITNERIPSLNNIDFYLNPSLITEPYIITNNICNNIQNGQYSDSYLIDNKKHEIWTLSAKVNEFGYIDLGYIKIKDRSVYYNTGNPERTKLCNAIRIENHYNKNLKFKIINNSKVSVKGVTSNNQTLKVSILSLKQVDGDIVIQTTTLSTRTYTNINKNNPLNHTQDLEINISSGKYIDIMIIYELITDDTYMNISNIEYDDANSTITPKYRCIDLNIKFKGTLPDYVKSLVYFSAEHNMYNSKILTQGLIFPDTDINNYNAVEQTYKGQFEGNNALRFYSFEYLFLKPNSLKGDLISKYSIGSFNNIYQWKEGDSVKGIKIEDYYEKNGQSFVKYHLIDRSLCVLKPSNTDAPQINKEATIDLKGVKILDVDVKDIIRHDTTINDVELEYIIGDNTSLQSTASDSFFRIINKNNKDIKFSDQNAGFIAELINPSNKLYDSPTDEKLQVISPIISKNTNDFILLSGDTYLSYLTLRLTTPSEYYASEVSNSPDLDSNNTVYRWILTFPIESRFNLNARYGANIINKPYFLHHGSETLYKELLSLSYKVDNFINTSVGKGYNTVYNENGVEEFEYYDKILGTSNHPHRIIRSLTQSPESITLNWRTFKTDDYKDLPFNRGEIVSLKTDNKSLYVQQKYGLHLLQQRDQLNNDDANNSYLGTSDLFNMEPKEIVYSPSGYIGCENYFDTDVNVSGYVVIDAVHKKIFLINGDKPLEISNIKTREHFEKFIDSSLRNPYNKQGRIINYNEDRNILYITQISPHLGGTKTMSFSPLNKAWVSFHTYIPDLGFVNRNGLFWGKNGKLYQPNSTIKGKYFGTTAEPSVIQFILNEGTIYNKLLKTIVWKDQVSFKGNDYIQHFFKETINHIMVHNFDQCSGKLDVAFNKSKEWWNGDTGTNKINLWRFNKLFDLVKPDNTSLFMKDVITPDPDKLKVDYKWYDVNRFICQFIYLTLWCNNTNNHEWELIDVHPEWQLDNRNDQTYTTKEDNQ